LIKFSLTGLKRLRKISIKACPIRIFLILYSLVSNCEMKQIIYQHLIKTHQYRFKTLKNKKYFRNNEDWIFRKYLYWIFLPSYYQEPYRVPDNYAVFLLPASIPSKRLVLSRIKKATAKTAVLILNIP